MTEKPAPNSVFVFVGGTRPEAIKLAPVVRAMAARGMRTQIVATGQQPMLFADTLACFDLTPDVDLAICEAVPAALLGRLVPALAALLQAGRPQAVVVQGDTTSALAGALAGAYAQVPVVHVEAGLRTGARDPFPEEMHRKLIGQIAGLHLAPTETAMQALAAEGVRGRAVMTGNSGIDALLWMAQRVGGAMDAGWRQRFGAIDFRKPLVLVTVHRRENHGAPLANILEALAGLADEAEIVLPVHPHPAVSAPVRARLEGLSGIHLTGPLDYPAFVWMMMRATLALTDSGGVQEEAPALGLPVLVLRAATERPEGVASGNARLVGTDAREIMAQVRGLLGGHGLAGMAEPALPYGAGDASGRMADAMMAQLARGDA